jgi:3-oxoacyl-[acyl-carrier-protein] synthase II
MACEVLITGAGVVSPLGDTPEALHAALVAGRSALARCTLFPLAGDGHDAAAVADFDPTRYLGDGNFRPLDRTGQLAAAAAALALGDAGLDAAALATQEVGLVLGTMYGSVRTIAEFDRRGLEAGPLYVKPFDFANSVLNAAAGQTAIWHRLRGPSTTVSTAGASGAQALALGAELIASGRATIALAGGAEELCFESFVSFARAGLLAPTGEPPQPFAAHRRGFALGEGAAFLVLESADSARARGARARGRLLGAASCFDPGEAAGDGRAEAVALAATGALAASGVTAADVDAVSVAASGGPQDDAEARGLARALGARAAGVPVSAPKALLGDALGAAGALQATALLVALAAGELPGVPGLAALHDLPLAGASAATTRAPLRIALLDGAGLDGHCCAVLLARADGAPTTTA